GGPRRSPPPDRASRTPGASPRPTAAAAERGGPPRPPWPRSARRGPAAPSCRGRGGGDAGEDAAQVRVGDAQRLGDGAHRLLLARLQGAVEERDLARGGDQ